MDIGKKPKGVQTMKNNGVQKVIIKHLARQTEYAVERVFAELTTDEDKETAGRIFSAVGIKTTKKEGTKK